MIENCQVNDCQKRLLLADIKEQRERIEYLELENNLLHDHLKGNDADLERFNRALEQAKAKRGQLTAHNR
jgi:NurA-like 5'-3' nuclease